MVGSWGPARHHSPVDDELAILVGATLSGRYRIDALVAKGGLGFVLAATDVELRRSVAIKFLRPEARRRPEVVARFSREARSAARLSGEHVARVFDVGEHEGSPFIVLEYLEGRDLESELRKRQSFPIAEAVGYVLQALDGLAEAHAIGVIHRDLKPPNLFLADVRGKRVLKILDFGISKAPSPGESDLTAAKMIMGTPTYMSPEQIQSTAGVDARTDVWSIGVVLYELLTKTLPFVGESTSAILLSVTMREPTPVHALRPEVPPGLSAVVMRCLAKDPDARFADVGELAAALAPWAPAGSGRSLARIARTLSVRSLRTVSPPASQAPVPPAVSTLPFIDRSSPPPYSANGRSSPSPPPASRAPRARGSWASRIVAGFVALGSALVGALVVLIFESTSTTTPVETAQPRFVSATEMFEPEHICVPGGRCRGRARSFRELPSTKVLAATLTASAKDDFERGVRLMEEEEYDDAIGAFRSAYESSRDPRLLWIIADCDKQR